MFWNKPKWSDYPGCFERHLQRRNENILFPVERRSISSEEISAARQKDKIDQELFMVHLNAFRSDLAGVKEMGISQGQSFLQGLQDLFEEAASVGGKAVQIMSNLEPFENSLMERLNSIFPNGKELLEKARSLSLIMRSPFIAQVKRKDTPILEGEQIATILAEGVEALIGACISSKTWPDFKPSCAEIKVHLNEAVKNGFERKKAMELFEILKIY
jgi:hypothetical protein